MISPNTFLLKILAALVRKMPWGKKNYGVPFLRRIANLIQTDCQVPVQCGVGKAYLDLREKYQAMMAANIYEEELEELISYYLENGDLYFDIGAQLGYTALQAIGQIGPSGKAVLIDADPRAISGLKRMVKSLPKLIKPDVTIVENICSDQDGQKLEFELLGVVGQSKVVTGKEERRLEKFEIETITIDTLTENLHQPIRFAKMDVEGHEISVLKGMTETLSKGRIEVMVIEKNPALLGFALQSPQDMLVFMTHFGYYAYSMERIEPVKQEDLESDQLENWVFCLKEKDIPLSIRSSVIEQSIEFKKSLDLKSEFLKIIRPPDPWRKKLSEAVAHVRHGDIDSGLEIAKALLMEFPEANDTRGHYAHWLLSKGLKPEAISQYEELVKREPDNREARKLLDGLKAGMSLGERE